MTKNKSLIVAVLCGFWAVSCGQTLVNKKATIYLGGDLSYINEMEDCGGKYRVNGASVEPYQLFQNRGANLVRIRLWHTPDWTNYSNFQDVKKSIGRAKKNNMKVLLDFHYSDTWADPAHQQIPKAWANVKDTKTLGDSVYNYTLNTLLALSKENLLPEMVQIGNEINSEILQPTDQAKDNIDWQRNVSLLNRGIQAVNDAAKTTGKTIETMLHIAQPENAIGWFSSASVAGILKFDWIGLSYYPKWSKYDLAQLTTTLATLKNSFKNRLMIVETGYPHTLKNADDADNILDSIGTSNYPITNDGQRKFMIDLTQATLNGGGEGVIYWEPAWISTTCKTAWSTGSHYDNATFFDAFQGNEALPAFDFFDSGNYK